MISAAGTMKPLPVRPVEGIANPDTLAPLPRPAHGRVMRPLPMPTPDAHDLADAIRTAAFQRMLDRLGVQQPLPVVDPTA
jgi:hypothetical protein